MRELVEAYRKMQEAKVGKRYQFVVPETDSPKMRKYLKSAELEFDVGTQGNKAIFDVALMDEEELDQVKKDLKNEKVRFTLK